jgi:hypothetical protein
VGTKGNPTTTEPPRVGMPGSSVVVVDPVPWARVVDTAAEVLVESAAVEDGADVVVDAEPAPSHDAATSAMTTSQRSRRIIPPREARTLGTHHPSL